MSATIIPVPEFPAAFYPDALVKVYKNDPDLLALAPNASISRDYASQILKKQYFSQENRNVLVAELNRQYIGKATVKVQSNIDALLKPGTYTITTGQQIHLMLGPMYVVYKIATVLNEAEKLAQMYPDNTFVPVFWMASEDHDFEEINHFTLSGKSFVWNEDSKGPVGRLSCKGAVETIDRAISEFSGEPAVLTVLHDFKKYYHEANTLADATRDILNHYFGDRGLVVIDPDAAAFKELFKDSMASDVTFKDNSDLLASQTEALTKLGIKGIIPPRRTNLFYLGDAGRTRIALDNGSFTIDKTGNLYSETEILQLLNDDASRFSPNVTLRPLYQETILPNLAYVAGPTEFIYWLQIYPLFEKVEISAPLLVLRNSVVISDKRTMDWLSSKGFQINDLFERIETIKDKFLSGANADNPLPALKSQLEVTIEKVNQALYNQKSARLRELKKFTDQYVRELGKEMRNLEDNVLSKGPYSEIWAKFTRIYNKYFDAQLPQERALFFTEKLAYEKDVIECFRDLPNTDLYPISICYHS